MPKRVISEKELTACYGLMFSEYPDIVNIRQLQAMLGISRHAAYDLLGEGRSAVSNWGTPTRSPKSTSFAMCWRPARPGLSVSAMLRHLFPARGRPHDCPRRLPPAHRPRPAAVLQGMVSPV